MGERSYLSIGEVLTLLREEFEDITVSKIRFLESQGLLDPERTPSGYRKFYAEDIERLRWILHQQRENFLPLKVIKDRLEESDRTGVPLDLLGGPVGPPEMPEPAPAPAPVEPEQSYVETVRTPGAVRPTPAPAPAPAPRAATAPPTGATAPVESVGKGTDTSVAARSNAVGGGGGGGTRVAGGDGNAVALDAIDSGPSGVSLSRDELANASGLDDADVRELERYGLLAGRAAGNAFVYDEEALIIARLAAGFRQFGVEPRHLRMYKIAADREAGFFEQVVVPLVKQRNPTSRRRALETLNELATLGEGLRGAMLRHALREYLNRH